MTFDLVVPTLGRDSLPRLLDALAAGAGPLPGQVLLVDDRPGRQQGQRADHSAAHASHGSSADPRRL